MNLSRRHFAQLAAVSATSAAAVPAHAQGGPSVKWRLASSFPKSVDALWGASPTVAKLVGEMSDGKFTIDRMDFEIGKTFDDKKVNKEVTIKVVAKLARK